MRSGDVFRRRHSARLEDKADAGIRQAGRNSPGMTLVQAGEGVHPVPLDDRDQNPQLPLGAKHAGDSVQHRSVATQDRIKKRSPGELNADLVGRSDQLLGEGLDRRHDEYRVRELRPLGPPEAVVEAGGIGVDADHKSVGVRARAPNDETPVASA